MRKVTNGIIDAYLEDARSSHFIDGGDVMVTQYSDTTICIVNADNSAAYAININYVRDLLEQIDQAK